MVVTTPQKNLLAKVLSLHSNKHTDVLTVLFSQIWLYSRRKRVTSLRLRCYLECHRWMTSPVAGSGSHVLQSQVGLELIHTTVVISFQGLIMRMF